ncbi:hypothetical protein P3T34_007179 [Kitasatospora sp. MAP12-44]|nr:hypothetical protein [Kitasatospora sp. MAP12-44]
MDGLGDLGVANGRVRGDHMGDHVRSVALAGLTQMGLVAAPARAPLHPEAGVEVVGRGQPGSGWREVLRLPPAHPLTVAVVLLHPGPAQDLDGGDLPQPAWRTGCEDGLQESETVPADLLGPLLPDVVAFGEAVGVDPSSVALDPLGRHEPGQPLRGRCSQDLQSRSQGLADELHPVQRPYRRQYMGGIGTLTATRAQQSELADPSQDQLQEPLLQAVLDQPGTEVAKDGEVEAWIVQFKAEQKLPVHPGPDLIGGLPVAEPLRVLQYRHQRQGPGRDRRPTASRERHGK